MTGTGRTVLQAVWSALGRDHTELALVAGARHPVPLPAVTDVGALAWASVAAASLAAGRLAGASEVDLDPDRIAVAYASERHFRLDGQRPEAFAPLSGFFRTADGWVRTHGNYAWHAHALRRVLALDDDDDDRDTVAAALEHAPSTEISAAVARAGGICRPVQRDDPGHDARLRAHPLVHVSRLGPADPAPLPRSPADAPLRGIRVLDLTRVIAGPVGTRALALLGADVLRVDPPGRPEISWQHLDTGHGKRSTVLDARSREFDALLAGADVVVLGYRPAGLDAIGLSPQRLAQRRPGLIVARLSAWGTPDQRGFDSIVQAASGISWVESADGVSPGALPAQALDHSAGYLLAAGVISLLARRAHEGGSWLVETSLRRIAAELLGLPRSAHPPTPPDPTPPDPTAHVQTHDVAGVAVTSAAPALSYRGGPTAFAAPRAWAADTPVWLGA